MPVQLASEGGQSRIQYQVNFPQQNKICMRSEILLHALS